MVHFTTILAQAADAASEATPATEGVVMPVSWIWEQINNLNTLEAMTFISFGVVWLLYGWRVFKILVAISFALMGLVVGVWTNNVLIGGNAIWLGIICMVLFAFASIPLMRWGVSVLGAVAGGALTALGWYAVGLPEQYIWAGAGFDLPPCNRNRVKSRGNT